MTKLIIMSVFIIGNCINTDVPCRELLIFEPAAGKELVLQELQELELEKEGLAERSVKIVTVQKGNYLFEKYHIKQNDFTIILIGKDGGEKYRTKRVLPAKTLFAIIDAMPMRQEEMKNKK